MSEQLDMRTRKEKNHDRTKGNASKIVLLVVIVITALFIFQGCAEYNVAIMERVKGVAASSLDEAFDETEDRAGEAASQGVSVLLRGKKKINVRNRGCSDALIQGIDGTRYGIVKAYSGAVIGIPISPFANPRDEFVLQINSIRVAHVGCRDTGVQFEEFYMDSESEDLYIDLG